jgi:hypothetical protein
MPEQGVEKDSVLCFDCAVYYACPRRWICGRAPLDPWDTPSCSASSSTCTSSSNSNSTCTSHLDAPRHADANATNGKPAILYAPYTAGGTKRGVQAQAQARRRGGGVYASGGGESVSVFFPSHLPSRPRLYRRLVLTPIKHRIRHRNRNRVPTKRVTLLPSCARLIPRFDGGGEVGEEEREGGMHGGRVSFFYFSLVCGRLECVCVVLGIRPSFFSCAFP